LSHFKLFRLGPFGSVPGRFKCRSYKSIPFHVGASDLGPAESPTPAIAAPRKVIKSFKVPLHVRSSSVPCYGRAYRADSESSDSTSWNHCVSADSDDGRKVPVKRQLPMVPQSGFGSMAERHCRLEQVPNFESNAYRDQRRPTRGCCLVLQKLSFSGWRMA
jgi:hypothetical protein